MEKQTTKIEPVYRDRDYGFFTCSNCGKEKSRYYEAFGNAGTLICSECMQKEN